MIKTKNLLKVTPCIYFEFILIFNNSLGPMSPHDSIYRDSEQKLETVTVLKKEKFIYYLKKTNEMSVD